MKYRVALGDGASSAAVTASDISALGAPLSSLDLLVGWMPETNEYLDFRAFERIRTIMGGYALRPHIDAGTVHYLPVRLGATPSLLKGALRQDALIASVARRGHGFVHTTESAWQRAVIESGASVLGIERTGVPVLDAGQPVDPDRVRIIRVSSEPPAIVDWGTPTEQHRAIGDRIASLVPEGSRVQYAPGPMGTAVLDALTQAVQIDTGILTDAVVGLDGRRCLIGMAVASYVAGGELLYDWSPGRATVERVEYTLNPARLASGTPFFSINTALEIDIDGQVNVEATGSSAVAGIGGHADYAFAASRSFAGLSVIGLPTFRGPHRTLVDRLAAPVTTASHDVDVVVTERGAADLRGLDRRQRRRALEGLWS